MLYIYNNTLLDNILLDDIIDNLNTPINISKHNYESDKLLRFYNNQVYKKSIKKKDIYIKYTCLKNFFILFIICIICSVSLYYILN